ncbi:MAG: T9SS type A sorting domain-containing protein [candidate division Zixibacteria bacterium]|nr:T9SS type A sorting domain-containing protein [candidate division Zixibacteria bacterium]
MLKNSISKWALLLIFVISGTASAQAPQTLWTLIYGDDNSNQEARDVQQTADGGFIVAGQSSGHGGGSYANAWLVKTDAEGEVQWNSAFYYTEVERANGVKATPDGGYIFAGVTHEFEFPHNSDLFIVKTNSSGNQVWTTTWGVMYAEDWADDVVVNPDTTYIIAGHTTSLGAGGEDVLLMKLSKTGDILWTKAYGGAENDYALSIERTSDGGYVMVGTTETFGGGLYDVYVVRTDSEGDTLWTKNYGGPYQDLGYDIKQTDDGGYIIAGWKDVDGQYTWNYYLIRTDSEGNILWEENYGTEEFSDFARSVDITADGGYIIGGDTGVFDREPYLVRTDADGNLLWEQTYPEQGDVKGYAVQTTSDGGYVYAGVIGDFYPDIYLRRLAPEIPCCLIDMEPDSYPVEVPPGGSFGFTGTIANPSDEPIFTDVWVGVNYEGDFYEVNSFEYIPLTPNESMSAHLNQMVPNYAPSGSYEYISYCGDYPAQDSCDSASFAFTVTGAAKGTGNDGWILEGSWLGGTESPSQVALARNYPNPFNAVTTIKYLLPGSDNVSLDIYNILGQKVKRLVSGYQQAGEHSIRWDASANSSGVYFYRLSAGDYTQTRRMILVK